MISSVSSHLGRQDAMRWTPQMEEALRVITLSNSCPADGLFVFQVRLQLLKQRADYVRQQDEIDCARAGTAHVVASAPRFLYLKTLRTQLQELRSSFPPDLHQIGNWFSSGQRGRLSPLWLLKSSPGRTQGQHTDILNTQAQYVGLYINQLGYSISRDCLAPDQSGRTGDGGMLLDFQRLECLWQSVENIKSWLDEFYSIPCSKLVGQPFQFWSQMILCITLLKYLSTLKDPEWDRQAVQNTVNLTSTMDDILQKLNLSS